MYYYILIQNYLITDGADSTCKIWDLSNNNKIPYTVYYDTESKIVSSDFRAKDGLHICLDEEGNFVIRNIKSQNDYVKIKLPKQPFQFVKFNPMNENQYFISTDSSFKIYDVRTNIEMEAVSEFSNSIDIFNDSNTFLTVKQNNLSLYNFYSANLDKLNEWNSFGLISHFNLNSLNFANPELLIVGNTNGDLFYSNLEN